MVVRIIAQAGAVLLVPQGKAPLRLVHRQAGDRAKLGQGLHLHHVVQVIVEGVVEVGTHQIDGVLLPVVQQVILPCQLVHIAEGIAVFRPVLILGGDGEHGGVQAVVLQRLRRVNLPGGRRRQGGGHILRHRLIQGEGGIIGVAPAAFSVIQGEGAAVIGPDQGLRGGRPGQGDGFFQLVRVNGQLAYRHIARPQHHQGSAQKQQFASPLHQRFLLVTVI